MNQSQWPSRIRVAALVALLVATSVACVKPDDPGVAISKKEASLVFGVKKDEPVVPANFTAPASLDLFDDPIDIGGLEFEPEPPGLPTPPTKPAQFCPKASPETPASRIPTVTVDVEPLLGTYKWKREGFVKFGNQQVSAAGFETRQVMATKRISPTQLTVTTRQVDLMSGTPIVQEKFFTIKNDVQQVNPTQGVPYVGPVPSPRSGPPDRGIVLTSIVNYDTKGNRIGAFEPTPQGLLLMALPVEGGEKFSAAAVDPKTGQTLTYDATTVASRRLDACGDVVEGFLVEGTMTSTIPDPESPTATSAVGYSVYFAPHYGGIIVGERFQRTANTSPAPTPPRAPDVDLPASPPPPPSPPAPPTVPGVPAPPEFDISFTIGQLAPAPK